MKRHLDPNIHLLLNLFILNFLIFFISLPSGFSQVNARQSSAQCRSLYVRWPRVRLNFPPAQSGLFTLEACKSACTHDLDPTDQRHQQCSAFNHRAGASALANECQLFQNEAVQHTDGYVEADDRYTFYWKYCVNTQRSCNGGDYAFTFLSDRYMAAREVTHHVHVHSLEDCLAECLNESSCRSVSFNRTDGGCHVSEQNQLTKPSQIKINNNPNYRIDYYENNCANVSNSFHFRHSCEVDGIRVEVDASLPYTGALYGLYDFFSCRIEPHESQEFGLFFPYPTKSNNCSDSMRYTGNEVILEVVLSTDGVEPLYFITSDDLTYQARCPIAAITIPTSSTVSDSNDIRKSPADYHNSDATKSSKSDKGVELAGRSSAKFQLEGVKIYTPPAPTSSTTNTTSASVLRDTIMTIAPSTTTKDVYTLPFIFTRSQSSTSFETSTIGNSTASKENLFSDASSLRVPTSKLVGTGIMVVNDESSPAGTTKPSNFIAALKANSLASIEARNAATRNVSTSTTVKGPSPSMEVILEKDAITSLKKSSSSYNSWRNTMAPNTNTLGTTTNAHHHQHPNHNDGRRHPGLEAILDPSELLFRDAASQIGFLGAPTTRSTATTARSNSNPSSSSSGDAAGIGGIREIKLDANNNVRHAQGQNFSFSTYVSFPSENRISLNTSPNRSESIAPRNHEFELGSSATIPTTTTTTTATTTTTTSTTTLSTTITTTTPAPTTTAATKTVGPAASARTRSENTETRSTSPVRPPGGSPSAAAIDETKRPVEPVIFDIFHNGQTTEAVVVGSRIALTFTPYFAIPPSFMSISGCQVEPIGSLYDWEKEPLAIIKEGCQADHVGLVCPPQRTDFGIRVTVEAFRYQTTTQVQYTCLVRICPFAVCPETSCKAVEGCPGGDDLLARSFGLRSRRHVSLEQIRAALAENPLLQQQLALSGSAPPASPGTNPRASIMNTSLQQQLITLGGDHLVRRRLIVVNSEEDLQYYVRTGEVPHGNLRA